jgi:hypothetical protein
MATTIARVQEILNAAVAAWEQKHHRDADLSVHDVNFGWASHDQLLAAVAFNHSLLAPEFIGNGNAEKTNLIIALRTGVPGFPRMPKGGPYVSDSEISEIANWIDGGALP